jgi:hypothetical protein
LILLLQRSALWQISNVLVQHVQQLLAALLHYPGSSKAMPSATCWIACNRQLPGTQLLGLLELLLHLSRALLLMLLDMDRTLEVVA